MGEKQKNKAPQNKKTSPRDSDCVRDDYLLGGRKYSYSKSPQNETRKRIIRY